MPILPNISPELLRAYEAEIAKRSSSATSRRKMSSLKRFFDWAHKEGYIQQNPISSLEQKVQKPIETKKAKSEPESIQIASRPDRRQAYFNLSLIAFVIVSTFMISIVRLSAMVIEQAEELAMQAEVQILDLEGQVLGVETEGGSIVTLARVLDSDFNLSVNGYVEGNVLRSTSTSDAPLVVANDTKVESLNADLLDGQDWTDLPDLITEASPDMYDFTEFKDSMTLDASTNIALGSLTLSTSGSGALDFNSTGQVSFAGNVDAENGLDVTGNITTSGDLTVTGGDITLGATSIFSGGDTASLNSIDSIDSTTEGTFESALDFLRSDSSDSYTSGTLSFSDGTFLDLSAIIHNDSALQGLRLPQNTSLTSPTSGEGFIAWDTDDNKLQVFNGTTWDDMGTGGGGASWWTEALGVLYPVNETVDLAVGGTATASASFYVSASTGDLTLINSETISNTNDSEIALSDGTNTLTLDLDEDTFGTINFTTNGSVDLTFNPGGNVGIGTTTPNQKLEITGNILLTTIGDQLMFVDDGYIKSSANNTIELQAGGTLDLKIADRVPLKVQYTNVYSYATFIVNDDGSASYDLRAEGDTDDHLLFVDASADAVGIGASSPISKLHVETDAANLLGKAALLIDQKESEDIFTASASGTTKMTLTNDGTLQLFNASSTISNTSGDITIDAASDNISFSGDNLINVGQIDASDQVRVGNLASNPTAIGEGSIYYNTTDDKLYYYQATGWTEIGSGGGSGSSWWTETLGVLYPVNETVDLAVGGTATASASFYVSASTGDLTLINSETISNAGDSELAFSDGTNTLTIDLDKDTFGAIDFTTNGSVDLTFSPGGNVGIGTTTPGELLDVAGDIRSTTGTLQIGNASNLVYSRLGTATTDHAGNLTAASDLLVSGDLELNGTLYLDGRQIANGDAAGTVTIILTSSPTDTASKLTASNWLIDNTANVGKAALIVDQQKNGDLFTASAAGDMKFRIANDGNVTIVGSGTMLTVGAGSGKIDVGTVDPVYNIGGEKYATYMAGMIGVKEETAGIIETNQYVPGVGYRHIIDFTNQERGSDLWLFSKATDIGKHIDDLIVLLSPSGNARSWYEVDKDNYTLSIYTSKPTSVSYRLTAPRFDAADWSNYNTNPESFGFVIEDDELIGTGEYSQVIPTLSDYEIFTENTEYKIRTISGEIVEGIEAFAGLAVANIKAGAIEVTDLTVRSSAYIADTLRAGAVETTHLATDTFLAFQGTIDNLLITNGLVSPVIETEMISPIADSDLVIDLNNSDPSSTEPSFGELIIKGVDEQEVVSIDAEGNATFSGTLESKEVKTKELVADRIYVDEIISKSSPSDESPVTIEQIEELLRQSQEDQELLADATDSNIFTATDSASLEELVLGQLYVTGQAAMNTLSVSTSLTVGSDFVVQSFVDEDGTIINSLDTLSAPLKLQSLAMAPLEIMAGKVKIDTEGNVEITGNLYVAGQIEASGLTLKGNDSENNSSFGNLLSLVNTEGTEVASIDASGSAQFATIETDKLVIAGSVATTSASFAGLVTQTSATAGTATIPAGSRDIIIENPKVTDNTLVYVTPLTSTQNNVLYVKTKESCSQSSSYTCKPYFVVGFDKALTSLVEFNWWIIDVTSPEQ
jgi:hypothetical protein